MAEFAIAVIMGLVEGITEFIPVSSTGHLIITGDLLKFTGEKAATFEIFIQLGAILAVVVLYFDRFWGLLPFQNRGDTESKGFSGFNGIFLLLLTTFPALLMGFFARKIIKYYLFGPMTVAWALGVGGLGILLAEKFIPQSHTEDLNNISYKQAFAVGCFQCLALWPGMSRSASTIIGGLIMGLDRRVAAEYSFLAAVPVMVAAVGYDLYKEWGLLGSSDIWFFSVGFVVSFLSAILAVKFFVTMLQRWSLAPFGWYRILIAPIIYLVMR
jgi:undecaprenyl-diphosphatase